MAEQPKPPPGKSPMMEGLKGVGPYLDLGMTFVVAIGGGAWLGYWADQHWGTAPWLLLAGAMLGIVVGFYHFFLGGPAQVRPSKDRLSSWAACAPGEVPETCAILWPGAKVARHFLFWS